jgi:branched-chain amino acid transport system substrate-binding protein
LATLVKETDMKKNGSAFLLSWLFVCVAVVLSLVQSSPAGAAEGQRPEPIRIGTIFSMTGVSGFVGTPQKEIFSAMIDDINAKGGIKGRQVELYYEDDKSTPTNAVVAATKLIKDKKVVAIVGTSMSDSALAIIPVCEQENIPFINSGPARIPFKKWIFSTGPGDVRGAAHMIDYAVKDLGAKKIALFHSTDAYGTLGQKVIMEELPKYPGVSIILDESLEPTDTNVIPQLTKIKAANADLMILFARGGTGAVVAKNYKQLGMTTRVLGATSLTIPEFVKIAGSIVDECNWIFLSQPLMIINSMAPTDSYRKNLYEPVKKMMQEKYGPAKEFNLFHASSYDALTGIFEALRLTTSIERTPLRDAIEKVRTEGFLGSFAPTTTDHQGAHVDPMRPMMFKNGQWVPYVKQ